MKIVMGILLLVYIINATAMRCGNALILEGDHVSKLIRACGEPTSRYDRGHLFYHNADGGNDIITVSETGFITDVSFTRD